MKHILVIADSFDSEQAAFHKAKELAKLTVADIHVVSFCFESYAEVQANADQGKSQINLKELVIEHVDKAWQKFVADQPDSAEVTHDVVWTKYIHEWVLEHCKSSHYDLIVKTGRRTEGFFYTPTDWHLFRQSNVPVYCVSSDENTNDKVVLVALDLTTEHKEKQQLNERLLEAAFQLSIQTNSVLHCCYAVPFSPVLRDLDIIDIRKKLNDVDQQVRQGSKGWLELYDIAPDNLHIKEGEPWQVIQHFEQKLNAQCTVVGSAGRKGIAGKLIGNTAEKVIHSAKTDLLVI